MGKLLLQFGVVAFTASSISAQQPTPPVADHHMHIQSARAAELYNAKVHPEQPLAEVPAEAVIEVLDAAHLHRAAVLSFAYRLAAPNVGLATSEADEVDHENAWTAAQVSRYPDRLVGFCSVNPLKEYATRSIERCKGLGLTGLKLHLANSHFDFANPAHLAALKQVFVVANKQRMPILLHMRADEAFDGRTATDRLIDTVLPEAKRVTVQIAHLAGWSRYDDVSDAALSRFAERCKERPRVCQRLYFDLAAALPVMTDNEANRARLRINMRMLGLWRFVFATDGPVGYQPETYVQAVRKSLPLDPAETASVLRNVAPYLRD